MPEQGTRQKNIFLRWFALCPARHVLTFASLALILAYFALRGSFAVMTLISTHVTRPWHRFAARALDSLPFSMAGVLIAAAVSGFMAYLVFCLVTAARHGGWAIFIYRLLITAVTLVLAVYAGFCLLWGVYYYTSDFESLSGIYSQPVSAEQLESVTRWFAGLVNDYGQQVQRDENGIFDEDLDAVFDSSAQLYSEVELLVPCLTGDALRAKPFMFSKAMSLMNFTGFFFPFTGEANINVDSPSCMIPSTIAHELAHQRGVAAEDEANFAAVLACLENGDPVYCYSACLLAYIYLGNALRRADSDAWNEVYASLSDGVKADLSHNNRYWAKFETPVSSVSDTVYNGFLQSYGQTLGLQTYGACVDLLVAYYYDISRG